MEADWYYEKSTPVLLCTLEALFHQHYLKLELNFRKNTKSAHPKKKALCGPKILFCSPASYKNV